MRVKTLSLLLASLLLMMNSCQESSSSIVPTGPTVIELSEKSLELQPGEKYQIEASTHPTSSEPIVWSSSNAEVATVFYGNITAKNVGETYIIATCNNVSDSCLVTVKMGDYSLVWSDEFDGDALNLSVWNIEVNGNGGGNNELQYYRAENVSVGVEPQSQKNCLKLTAKKEDFGGKKATSGRITTQNNVTFTHGMIEANILIPYTEKGLWPAFWMMGNDISTVSWPSCGEIDIMEMGHSSGFNAGVADRYFNGACHWGYYTNGNYPNYAKSKTNSYSIQGDFHTFRCYWDEEKIAMYLDQDKYPDALPYFEMTISGKSSDSDPGNYFHKPVFVLFNLAIGGNFPGIFNIDGITALSNGDAIMYVDYVRIYQRGLTNETLTIK